MSGESMGIGALTQYSTQAAKAHVQEAAQMAMLKKSMDIQAQSILPLINSLSTPSPAAANGPSHLGNAINVHA